jgi:hypothetical protein
MRIRRVAAGIAATLVWPGSALAQTGAEAAGAAPAAGAPPQAAPASGSTSAPSPPVDVAPPPLPAPTVAPPPLVPAAPAVPAAVDGALRDEVAALRAEVAALRTQVEAQRPAKPPPAVSALGYPGFWPWMLPPEGISFAGYVQAQYETHQNAQNQLSQDGALLNSDRFVIRRARVGVTGEWEYAALALQLDGNTTNGPQVDLRKAEASLQYRPDRERPPIVMATLGLFDTPFGYEIVQAPHLRWFMERSTASQALWPGEPDLGLRVAGAVGFFRWTIAGLNGNPLGTTYAAQDPLSKKDVLFRVGFDTLVHDDLHLAGDVSAVRGTGFHPGSPATSPVLQFTDVNGSGNVQPTDYSITEAKASTPSLPFDRWAVGADVRAEYRSPLGVTTVYGEFVLAANMDRGLFVADPIANGGTDVRELGFYVAVTQEISRYGVVGFRYDYYNPNLDSTDGRGGGLIPYSEAIRTASPLFGLVLPDHARLLFQYDIVQNALGRTPAGVPTALADNVATIRLQVQP